jgi:hypothetical protein
MLLEVSVPINICGDTHGQYHDLLRLFEMGKFPPFANYMFLGDYVDRAKQSIETMSLLMCYKIKYVLWEQGKGAAGDWVGRGVLEACPYAPSLCVSVCRYPESFFLLRGNHECASLNRIYGTLALPTQQYTCPVPHTGHTPVAPSYTPPLATRYGLIVCPPRGQIGSRIPASSLIKLVWPSLLDLAPSLIPQPPSPFPSFFLVCRLL